MEIYENSYLFSGEHIVLIFLMFWILTTHVLFLKFDCFHSYYIWRLVCSSNEISSYNGQHLFTKCVQPITNFDYYAFYWVRNSLILFNIIIHNYSTEVVSYYLCKIDYNTSERIWNAIYSIDLNMLAINYNE